MQHAFDSQEKEKEWFSVKTLKQMKNRLVESMASDEKAKMKNKKI